MTISSNFTSLCLKMIGGVMLISSLFNYIFMMIPFNWGNAQWQILFTNEVVSQGINPLLGIIFLIIGWWIADTNNPSRVSSGTRMPVFILASVLGLIFLLLVPLHLSNISKASAIALNQINQQAGQEEAKIQNTIQQINSASQNPDQFRQQIAQIDQILKAGKIQNRDITPQQRQALETQKNQFQQIVTLSENPGELKKRLDAEKNKLQNQLDTIKAEQEKRAKTIALKQSLKTGVSSLILAIGYIVVGWFGLRNTKTTNTISS